jgi:hypothetical protein
MMPSKLEAWEAGQVYLEALCGHARCSTRVDPGPAGHRAREIVLMLAITYVLALLQYLWSVAVDGDFQNDWLTHLPYADVAGAIHLAHLLYGQLP